MTIRPGHDRSAQALETGLVNAVAPDADLAASDLAAALEVEADVQARCGRTEDHRNATEAFLAKQTPTFQGR